MPSILVQIVLELLGHQYNIAASWPVWHCWTPEEVPPTLGPFAFVSIVICHQPKRRNRLPTSTLMLDESDSCLVHCWYTSTVATKCYTPGLLPYKLLRLVPLPILVPNPRYFPLIELSVWLPANCPDWALPLFGIRWNTTKNWDLISLSRGLSSIISQIHAKEPILAYHPVPSQGLRRHGE